MFSMFSNLITRVGDIANMYNFVSLKVLIDQRFSVSSSVESNSKVTLKYLTLNIEILRSSKLFNKMNFLQLPD